MAVIAHLLGGDRDVVRTVPIVAAALLVEMKSFLGLLLVLGASAPGGGRRQVSAPAARRTGI